MSYRDDEEFKEDDMEDDEDVLLNAGGLDEPIDDDLAISDDIEDDEPLEGFAGIDGAEF